MLVIGKNPVIEILKSDPSFISKIILLKRVKPDDRSKEIADLAKKNSISLIFLGLYDFKKYFSSKNKEEGIAQGVLAFVKDYDYTSLRDMVEECKKVKNPLILLLDNITDPHNLGAIARSAVCLGADGLVIPKHNSAEVNHTVMKTSSGAVSHIKITRETNLSNSIQFLKNNGYWIFGTDITATKTIFETNFRMPVGLIIGSEGAGVRKKLLENCDELIRIPMAGSVSSLNASVSAAVFLYEIFRQKNL